MSLKLIAAWTVAWALAVSPCALAAGLADPVPNASNEPQQYTMTAQEAELYDRLRDESPIQEGWTTQFAGEGTLALLGMPELIIWQINPPTGRMELKWYRDLHEILPEGSANPMLAVSPDGTCALISPSDGSIYLVKADETIEVASEGTQPDALVWAQDSQSYAYLLDSDIYATLPDGSELIISGEMTMPVYSEQEWLNPRTTPSALAELLQDEKWQITSVSSSCVLFEDNANTTSCAYLFASGEVVNYPFTVYTAESIGDKGACPEYDENSAKYRLYLSEGSYADIPMLEVINEGDMANPFGWLGDSVCVLEQNFSSRSAFKLHAANTSTGITYTLLTPWEYVEVMKNQQG